MIYLKLFFAFFQVGLFAFGGGYAILPFIQDIIVDNYQWLSLNEMMDIVTISQMTPGPIALNAATFVGTKVAGLTGSIVATIGTILPQLIIMTILGKLVFSNKKLDFLDKALLGLKPGIVGLIFIASLSMIHSSIFNNLSIDISNINPIALISFVLGFFLYIKEVDIIKIIISGGLIGFIFNLII